MIMPSLWDIFDEFRMAKHISHDVRKTRKVILTMLDGLELDGLDIGFDVREGFEKEVSRVIRESQFHGFVQGFCFARSLFCENTDKIK